MIRRKRTPTLSLTRRSDGRWQKKISGQMYYFTGSEEEARAALLGLIQRQTASAPPDVPTDAIPVRQLADAYAVRCEDRVKRGELAAATWQDYDDAIAKFIGFVRPHTLISRLTADHFADFRCMYVKRLGPWALDRLIQGVRTMFKWGYNAGHIANVPRYGDGFGKTRPADKALHAAKRRERSGDRAFGADELVRLLRHPDCKGDLRTFVLLGLNAGLYSVDCSDLLWCELVSVPVGLCVDRSRVKTGTVQRFPLWPEVVEAIDKRRRHREQDRIFETAHGNPWNTRTGVDSISMLFQRLRMRAGVTRARLGFGAFRHTHVSAVNALPDRDAARMVRGHQVSGIERHYDFPSWERLKAITDHARQVLLLNTLKLPVPALRADGSFAPIAGTPKARPVSDRRRKPRSQTPEQRDARDASPPQPQRKRVRQSGTGSPPS